MAKALRATFLLLALALLAGVPAAASATTKSSVGEPRITAQQGPPSVSVSANANVQVRLNSANANVQVRLNSPLPSGSAIGSTVSPLTTSVSSTAWPAGFPAAGTCQQCTGVPAQCPRPTWRPPTPRLSQQPPRHLNTPRLPEILPTPYPQL